MNQNLQGDFQICISVPLKKLSPRGVYKKGDLKNVTALTGNHLCRSLRFNEVEGWKAETFKKALVRK